MKLHHPAVTSDVFKLVVTLEFDLSLGDHFLPTRIELFQDTERKRHFRCRLWERDLYHLQLTLSRGKTRKRTRLASDEQILVERTWELSDKFEDFEAANPQSALKKFLSTLKNYLNRVSD
jgi:hypothetical protein